MTKRNLTEELHPDLEGFLDEDGILHHPLLIVTDVDRAGSLRLNEVYRSKVSSLQEASNNGDWSQTVWLHERPYRVDAFNDIVDKLRDRQYWELLAEVWIDSENIFQNQDEWQDLWGDGRSGKEFAMNASERETLAHLPHDLTIYRGIGEGNILKGLSWTLNKRSGLRGVTAKAAF